MFFIAVPLQKGIICLTSCLNYDLHLVYQLLVYRTCSLLDILGPAHADLLSRVFSAAIIHSKCCAGRIRCDSRKGACCSSLHRRLDGGLHHCLLRIVLVQESMATGLLRVHQSAVHNDLKVASGARVLLGLHSRLREPTLD